MTTPTPTLPVTTPEVDLRGYDPTVHAEAKKAAAYARRFATLAAIDAPDNPPRWLALLGKSGVGKTHLARAIAAHVTHHRPQPEPAFFTWGRVCELCAKGEWPVLAQLRRQRFLVIDDLTAPFDMSGLSAFDRKMLRELGLLMDARLGKWTVWTDNKLRGGAGGLAEVDVRIASRLGRGHNVFLEFRACPDFCLKAS